MKRILISIPFLFIMGLMIWTVNSLIATMFIPGKFAVDSSFFSASFENIYTRIFVFSISILLYMILFRIFIYERDEKLLRRAFNHSFPMAVTGFNNNLLEVNESYREIFGAPKLRSGKVKCYENRPGNACHTRACPLELIKNGQEEVLCEHTITVEGRERHYMIKAKPIRNSFDETVGIIETFNDITERKRLEDENYALIEQLRESLSQVKQLSGMLPICPSCKHVRDDDGYWEQIESYINDHSEVEIVHSLCPECREISHINFDEMYAEPSSGNGKKMDDMQWLKIAG